MAALMMYAASAMAQDIIVTKEGVDIKAQVLEVGTGTVRYRLFDEPDGAIYTMRKSDILMIRHHSGRNEVFKSVPGYAAYREPVADIVPGMKYKDLKKIYNYSDWYSAPGDKTNPALMGVCSWLIPGLGQMISGELGRGFAWLDTGNHDSLLDAADFVAAFQKRQGLYVSCIEEIAYKRGFIDKEQLLKLAEPLMKTAYGQYLVEVANGL